MTDVNIYSPDGEVSGADEIIQRCLLVLWRKAGEWIMDPDKGLPYLSRNANYVAEVAQDELRAIPGVGSVGVDVSGDTIRFDITITPPTGTDVPVTVAVSTSGSVELV